MKPNRNLQGMLLVLTASLIFTAVNALAKACAPRIPAHEILFFRFACSLPFTYLFVVWHEGWRLRIEFPMTQLMRGLNAAFGFWCMFYAIGNLPLADATTLHFSAPLFAVFIATFLLKEPPTLTQLSFVALGFIGVICIVRPSSQILNVHALIGLTSACCLAITLVSGRWLSLRGVSTGMMTLTLTAIATVIAGFTLFSGWVTPNITELWLLLTIGILGGIGQLILTEGFVRASTVAASSVMNTAPLWSALTGYCIWCEIPHLLTFVGIAFIAFSTIAIAYGQTRSKMAL